MNLYIEFNPNRPVLFQDKEHEFVALLEKAHIKLRREGQEFIVETKKVYHIRSKEEFLEDMAKINSMHQSSLRHAGLEDIDFFNLVHSIVENRYSFDTNGRSFPVDVCLALKNYSNTVAIPSFFVSHNTYPNI